MMWDGSAADWQVASRNRSLYVEQLSNVAWRLLVPTSQVVWLLARGPR